jgi:hypothetical protein
VSAIGAAVICNDKIDGHDFQSYSAVSHSHLTRFDSSVGFPLAFSFGARERIESYDRFYTAFSNKLNVDLSQYILLSDQAAALKVIGRSHPRHLFCLRHLLQGLRKSKYGQPIGNLVKACGQKEFDVLCDLYARRFRALWVTCGTELNDLRA